MKKSKIFIIFIFTLSFSFTQENKKSEFFITDIKEGMSFEIKNNNGSIEIEQWKEKIIKINISKFSWSWEARKLFDQVEIIKIIQDNKIFITTKYNLDIDIDKILVFINLKVPEFINIQKIENRNGKILLSNSNTNNKIILKNSNGRIVIENFKGNINAQTNNASISLKNIEGNCIAKTSNGRIKINNVKGNLDLYNSNSKISIFNVTGDLNANAERGNIEINNLKGKINAKTSFGYIKISDSDCFANLNTSFGKIKGDNLSGFIIANTGYGDIEILNSDTIIEAQTIYGNIEADILSVDKQGTFLKTDYGSITCYIIKDIKANIKINNLRGLVELDKTSINFKQLSFNEYEYKKNDNLPYLIIETKNGKIKIFDAYYED